MRRPYDRYTVFLTYFYTSYIKEKLNLTLGSKTFDPYHKVEYIRCMKCPNCQTDILANDVNIQADIAKCAACGHAFKASDNVAPTKNEHFNINQPPKGAWYRRDMDGIVIGASMRSPIALLNLFFMLFWPVFGIYASQHLQEKFDFTIGIFGPVLLIIFIIVWGTSLMSILGKVEIKLNRQGGEVFKGVGFIGRKKTFLWQELSSANHKIIYKTTSGNTETITFPIQLPVTLPLKRRHFLAQAIKEIQAQYQ